MPNKTFAFITELPNMFSYNSNVNYDFVKLSHRFNDRKAIIKEFIVLGNKRTGFYIAAKIMVGEMARYMVDIENAIQAQELKLPVQFEKANFKDDSATAAPSSLADELKKLKDLFDSGAITQEEYTAAKKKLIEQ